MVSFRPLADPMKVSRRRLGVSAGDASLMAAGTRVLIFAFLRCAGFHSDVDVACVRASWKRRVVGVERPVGGTRVAAEMTLQPFGRLELPRLVLLLQVQRLLRQGIFPSGGCTVRKTCNLRRLFLEEIRGDTSIFCKLWRSFNRTIPFNADETMYPLKIGGEKIVGVLTRCRVGDRVIIS